MDKNKFIESLTVIQLKKLVKICGMATIPRTYNKTDLVKYAKEHATNEILTSFDGSEKKEPKDNKIQKTGKKVEKEEKKQPEQPEEKAQSGRERIRQEYIVELQKERIHHIVIEAICESMKEPIPKGKGVNFFDAMSDKLLKYLHEIFIQKVDDSEGRFFEYRSANWLVLHVNELASIRTRHAIAGTDELRLVGFDIQGLPYLIGEFADKGINEGMFQRSIENARKILDKYGSRMKKQYKSAWLRIYFFVPEEYANDLVKLLEQNNSNMKSGTVSIKRGIFHTDYFLRVLAYKVEGTKYMSLFKE